MRFLLYVEIDPNLGRHEPLVNAWLAELESISPDLYLHPSRTQAWLDLTTIKSLVESSSPHGTSSSMSLTELQNYYQQLSYFRERLIHSLLQKKLSSRYIKKVGLGPSFFWSAQLSDSPQAKPASGNPWLRRWLFTDTLTWPKCLTEILLPSSLSQTGLRAWQNLIQDLRSLGYQRYIDFLRHPLTQTALAKRWGELGEYLYTECYQWPAFTPFASKTLAQPTVLSVSKTLDPAVFDPHLLLEQFKDLWTEAERHLQTQSLTTRKLAVSYRLEWSPDSFSHELQLVEPAREFAAWLPLLKRLIQERPSQAPLRDSSDRFEGSQLGVEWIGFDIYVEKHQAKQLSLLEDSTLPLQEAARWVELCQHWGVAWGRLVSQENPLPEKQNALKPVEPKHFFSSALKTAPAREPSSLQLTAWEPCLWLHPPLPLTKKNWTLSERGPTEQLEPWGQKTRYYRPFISPQGLPAWCYQEGLQEETLYLHGWLDPRPFKLKDTTAKQNLKDSKNQVSSQKKGPQKRKL